MDLDQDRSPFLVFDDATGRPVEFDLRGTPDEVTARLQRPEESPEARGPGRPKLGVVAREVTLLPRHWEWLNSQPGGASVALRKLVEAARTTGRPEDKVRMAQEAAYRFMTAMAGNLKGYEDAIRALYARDLNRFDALIAGWPADVRRHAEKLAGAAFAENTR